MSEPLHEFPGAAPTPSAIAARQVVIGRFAECTIDSGSGAAVPVLLFDWEVTVDFRFADATAFGDRWQVNVFEDARWSARAKGYVVPLDAVGYIKAATGGSGPVLLTFKGYSDVTATTLLWAGPCYIQRGRISAPMALMEQEFELVGSGPPTAGSNF